MGAVLLQSPVRQPRPHAHRLPRDQLLLELGAQGFGAVSAHAHEADAAGGEFFDRRGADAPLPSHRIFPHQQPLRHVPCLRDLADHGEGEGAFALEDFSGARGHGSGAGGSRVRPGMTVCFK